MDTAFPDFEQSSLIDLIEPLQLRVDELHSSALPELIQQAIQKLVQDGRKLLDSLRSVLSSSVIPQIVYDEATAYKTQIAATNLFLHLYHQAVTKQDNLDEAATIFNLITLLATRGPLHDPSSKLIQARLTYDAAELNFYLKNYYSGLSTDNVRFETLIEGCAEPQFLSNLRNVLERLIPRMALRFELTQFQNVDEVPYVIDNPEESVSGSNCVVHKATCRNTREIYAVKSIQDLEPELIAEEINILRHCHHANVIRIIDAYQVGDRHDTVNIVTAPWAPYTLEKFVDQKDWKRGEQCPWFHFNYHASDRIIINILLGIALGVGYLHAQSIKHKDIKPANILLFHPDSELLVQPIVTDVGISKVYKQGDTTKHTNSTYQYLAPEQTAKVESSLRSDIWQLGCCFALVLAVWSGGDAAVTRLWNSVTEGERSCQISRERQHFLKALDFICCRGNPPRRQVYEITKRMLAEEPCERPDIHEVIATLSLALRPA
ncbi:kinase-like domain-containing protein [Xylariales sp. PMI_506]|nr:kinase-like domain-containing protein [Xylariales sp. PMI_506]